MRVTRHDFAPAVLLCFSILALAGCASRPAIGPNEFYWFMNRACASGDEYGVRLLLEAGADPSGPADYARMYKARGLGIEPSSHLFVAASAGHSAIVQRLLAAGAAINAREGEGQTPLWAAAAGGHEEVVRLLLANGADPTLKGQGQTPRQVAARKGFLGAAELLEDFEKSEDTAHGNRT